MYDIINENLVFLDVYGESKEMLIHMAALKLKEEGRIEDAEVFTNSVLEREEVYPTAIGFETAIPHGKSPTVLKTTIAYMKLSNSILWEEDEQVKYVILLAIPQEAAGDFHVKMLAELSRNLMRDDFRETLFHQIGSAGVVQQIINLGI